MPNYGTAAGRRGCGGEEEVKERERERKKERKGERGVGTATKCCCCGWSAEFAHYVTLLASQHGRRASPKAKGLRVHFSTTVRITKG